MIATNQIYQGDCLEVMQRIDDGAVDMVLCDLPYGTTDSHWDSLIDLGQLWQHYQRVIKHRGAIVLTAVQPFTTTLINSNPEWFKYEWIWHKTMATDFLNGRNKPLKAHENILVFSSGTVANKSPNLMVYNPQIENAPTWRKVQRSDPRRDSWDVKGRKPFKLGVVRGNEGRLPRSVITFSNGNAHQKNIHNTQKPVALFSYLIRTYTNPGDLVLDPTAGSGTTAIAAIETGRNWICIEKDEGYYEATRRRIEERLKQPFLPGIDEAVEKPVQLGFEA